MIKEIEFLKTRDVKSPSIGTKLSAGIDFYIPNDLKPIKVWGGHNINIPSGIKTKLPMGHCLIAFNKSGMAIKGWSVGACVIDEDYTGELHINLINTSSAPLLLEPGQKAVQFILIKTPRVKLTEKTELKFNESERKDGAFGSTGIK
jgi:deoxyuridine 5'-triphosphate nucleotidohydrolase